MPRTGSPGRVLHLGLTEGELANRIVVVGHPARAELLAKSLTPEEPGAPLFQLLSDRGFLTFTGLFEGKRMSVVSIGMGLPMMDFFVREAKAILTGPVAVVRFGTCGCLQSSISVGGVSVAQGSVLVQRNYGYFGSTNGDGGTPYLISGLCPADEALSQGIVDALKKQFSSDMVFEGVNITADSFYSSQGRQDPNFEDSNTDVLDEVLRRFPNAITMEMETFQLLHLAQSSRPAGSIRAAAAVVNVANRPTGTVVEEAALQAAELNGGKAVMEALAAVELS